VDGRHDVAVAALFAASSPIHPAVAAFSTSARVVGAGGGRGGTYSGRCARRAIAATSTTRGRSSSPGGTSAWCATTCSGTAASLINDT